ncbi:ABC transporter ATP-binding protein [Rhodococcus sp. (in: high G+C Gram-positive bacteria)]|uniref:ABC transporter ATP-binding protein n=1 Tax=Rhodococcus sp. TaxID=1831 RepID=UPI00257F2149|nr:ABC transporter ATP-binding protein [Rhodococcus sp. (in: high G+C Gram-positive bacteria)]MBQ7803109.1 ABC transporter ATP-binding protein [Rhodococcus sp. (in: high G+C Gram-positive bacteria)]
MTSLDIHTTSATATCALEVTDLRVWFDTPRGMVRAVDGVNIDVGAGRTLGIVGESGSGKSVLSRAVMNILSPNASVRPGSTIQVEGHDTATLSKSEARDLWGSRIAMVFQDPMTSLTPVLTIGAQLSETLRRHLRMTKAEAAERAEELLDWVGIPEPRKRLAQYPHNLSGGMRQRVVIALALACSPRLLIADEPTTALDVTVQHQILTLLARLQRENDMAMILITHDLGVVASRTDEIAVMYAGRVVERAPTRDLFRATRHPYTRALLRSIPRISAPSHTRLAAIPGRPPTVIDPPPGCAFAPRCPNAQPRCLTETPQLTEAPRSAPAHRLACFYPAGTPEGDAAEEKNMATGITAAGLPVDSKGVL